MLLILSLSIICRCNPFRNYADLTGVSEVGKDIVEEMGITVCYRHTEQVKPKSNTFLSLFNKQEGGTQVCGSILSSLGTN